MATFTIIQVNGDHINDCDNESLGIMIKELCRNPLEYERALAEGWYSSYAVRWIGTTGIPVKAEGIKQYWLAKPREQEVK